MYTYKVRLIVLFSTEGKNIGDIETRTTTKSVELPGEEVDVRNEVSIQANDYEIERATGVLPARKRFIPLKYRYKTVLGVHMNNNIYVSMSSVVCIWLAS